MTLSTSRQQFLAYETHNPEDFHYGRRGGIFISKCICISYIILAVLVAVIVGVIVHFITYFKMTQSPSQYWDDMGPYSLTFPSPDLKLPTTIAPSFYRLKIKPDLINSNFSGEVYITLRPNKRTKEIILHSKNLNINNNVRLTEQIYEKVETVYRTKRKRDVPVEATVTLGNTITIAPNVIADSAETNSTTETTTLNITEFTTEAPTLPVDTQITHSSINEIKILGISEGIGDRLIIDLETSLKAGVDYVLELSFKGNISNALTGFYKSTYTNSKNEVKTLAVTQFEPTSARTAFPCFDEPAFKAKFEISIAHPENITVLSNMELASEETILEQPNWKWAHFERSVEMSTYLVAYVLSDFKSLETNYTGKDNVTKPVRVWTRPELITQANYALTITPKLLRLYEDVFGVPYALKKLDLIAIPDFSSGAMENWGLITFRETTLLFDEKESSPREKQNVAVDIAHELAHQWFGNLVTMKWWTDLWLNEGFATYIEYLAVDHLEPEWKMFESFSLDKMNLLRLDALKHTSPVSKKVVDNSEITQKFDDISYMKAANLIRMLNHTVSKELFHKGLAIYLNNWKYSNAEENDLWEAMSTAIQSNPALAGQSVVEFMNSWTRQAGYPVVNINRNYETGVVEMEQRLYTSTKEPYQHMIDQLWHIPISYTAMDAPLEQWSTAPKTWLKDRIGVFKPNITKDQALYVNVDAIGYYRVNYDQRNWELLGEALKSGHFKSPLMKAQLLDDAFNLAKTSQLNYNYALGLTTYVKNGEDSRVVWDLLLNNMAFLKHNLRSTSGYVYFQDFLKSILSKQLERINYGLDKPKDDNEAFLIENLVMWECYVESPRCLDWARTQFDSWTKQTNLTNNPIPSYLRPIVYNMALRHGGRREFEFLWDAFMHSTDPYVKSIIITNLPYTRDESLITMLLEKSLTEIPKQYAVAVWTVEPPTGTRIAQNFLINNFDKVYSNFTEIDPFIFSEVLNGAFGFISTNEELNRLKSFALEHKEKLLPVSQTLQRIVDIAQLRIEWITKYAKGINLWLKNYVTGKTQENGVEMRTPVPVPYLNSTDSGIATTDKPTNIDNTTSQTS